MTGMPRVVVMGILDWLQFCMVRRPGVVIGRTARDPRYTVTLMMPQT